MRWHGIYAVASLIAGKMGCPSPPFFKEWGTCEVVVVVVEPRFGLYPHNCPQRWHGSPRYMYFSMP